MSKKTPNHRVGLRQGILGLFWILIPAIACADLSRSARRVTSESEVGTWQMENSVQLEKERDEKVWTAEAGIQHIPKSLPPLSILLEPVIWEWHRPKDEPNYDGQGDTELSLYYMIAPPGELWPAISLGGMVKIPTADKPEIGSGKPDYSGIVIIGNEWGEIEVNLELEFSTFGQPDPIRRRSFSQEEDEDDEENENPTEWAGGWITEEQEELYDQFSYTFAVDYGISEHLSCFVEAFGNSRPSPEEEKTNGIEFGLEADIEPTDFLDLFLQTTIDTEEVFTTSFGLEWNW